MRDFPEQFWDQFLFGGKRVKIEVPFNLAHTNTHLIHSLEVGHLVIRIKCHSLTGGEYSTAEIANLSMSRSVNTGR